MRASKMVVFIVVYLSFLFDNVLLTVVGKPKYLYGVIFGESIMLVLKFSICCKCLYFVKGLQKIVMSHDVSNY